MIKYIPLNGTERYIMVEEYEQIECPDCGVLTTVVKGKKKCVLCEENTKVRREEMAKAAMVGILSNPVLVEDCRQQACSHRNSTSKTAFAYQVASCALEQTDALISLLDKTKKVKKDG